MNSAEIQDDDTDEEDNIQDDDASDYYDTEEEESDSKESEEDEILTADEIKESVVAAAEVVQPTTSPSFTSPKPVSSSQLTTLLTSTLAQEGVVTTVTPAPIYGTGVGDIGDVTETTTDFTIDLDSIGPGACLFENKIYVSAQQIPRDNPCDFCFCFRGDIICLQQSCPPPIPGCTEEIISGFCCPRYECPVKMSVHNVTKHTTHQQEPLSIASWFGWGAEDASSQQEDVFEAEVKGCEVQGQFYEAGSIVTASSGPCLQCR